ncbi:CsiV family protein [Aliikangiella maris]|uniref:CsiV family protein n=2 Tax=Aliikangiella maris TaxID=3162458 RepID=A0ABV3MM04_9GAMM
MVEVKALISKLMTIKYTKIACKLATTLLLTGFYPIARAADVEEPRWFEIEIIVYKTTSSTGLYAESWAKDTQLTPAKNLVDFLQPFEAIQNTQEEKDAEPIELTELAINNTEPASNTIDGSNSDTANPAATNSSKDTTNVTAIAVTEQEQPFKLLPEEQLQLANEARSIARHPDYQVLTHLAWRQPVYGPDEAASIRIAGGQNFSHDYWYNGNKKQGEMDIADQLSSTGENESLENFKQENHSLVNEVINTQENLIDNPINGLQQNIGDNVLQPTEINTNTNTQSDLNNPVNQSTLTTTPLKPVPWVPELDGDITIHVQRYLHIKTNLYLRRPDKEEVEVINLDMFQTNRNEIPGNQANTLAQSNNVFTSSTNFQLEPANNNPLDSLLTSNNQSTTQSSDVLTNNNFENQFSSTLSVKQGSQFSWEIGDDFLETESEKIYIERLFNYSLRQSRRVKSGELHFFDHPLLGVLIMIKPYSREQQNTDEIPALTSSSL